MNAYIERSNYENDHRVRAGGEDDWFESFNESTMTVTVLLYGEDDDGEEFEEHVELPVRYAVCSTCDGKGTHVNPSIDCCGLTREDFDDDPVFAEDYFSGVYDVQCYGCGGKRVTPEIDETRLTPEQQDAVKRLAEKGRSDAEFEAVCRAERMMGA